MSTLKADAVTAKTSDTDVTITGSGTGVPNIEAGFKVGGTVGVPVSGLQVGTDGELITWDASGDPAAVAVGTATHVLTSNGAGAAPTFQAAGGGAWNYITTVTASAAATVDFESQLSSTYGLYMVSGVDVHPALDTRDLRARFGVGSTYDTASNYCWLVRGNKGATSGAFDGGAENSSDIKLIGNEGTASQSMGNAADEASAFNFYIPAPSGTTYNKTAFWTMVCNNSDNKLFATTGEAVNTSSDSTAAITSVRFFTNTGNVSGTFRLYGLATS